MSIKEKTNPGVIARIKKILVGDFVETGATASQNIGAGKFFVWRNKLKQAKSAISSGDTFTEGTNMEAVAEGALNALNSNLSVKYFSEDSFSADNKPTKNLPNDWKVLIVTIWVVNSMNAFPFYVLRDTVNTTMNTIYRMGFYVSSTDWARAHFLINKSATQLTVTDCQRNGSDQAGTIFISYI